jgi:peroxiredoxin
MTSRYLTGPALLIDAKYKSFFIIPAASISLLLLIWAIAEIVIGGHDRAAWAGAAISALPLPFLILRLMVMPVARTSENLPFLLFLSAVGVMIPAWEKFMEGVAGWTPLIVALVNAGIMLLYVFWYSRFGRIETGQLAVGAKLPEFRLRDAEGIEIATEDFAGSPAVLLFYRGNWCPFCMAQIREIVDRYRDMSDMGIKVALISPQSDEHTRQLAGKHDVPFHFLIDEDNRFAESLGIAIDHGVPLGIPGGYSPQTVMPTVVVTNANGTIVFSDQTDNYRVRPEPDVFLAILRRSGAVAQ